MNIAAYHRQALTTDAVHIPLRTAYLCAECQRITDGVPHGVCRLCGSTAVRAVAELLLSAPERAAWRALIQGGSKP